MADDTNTPLPVGSGRGDAPERGGRSGPNREPGGFRIRLSDNEMQAARALQEAFGLRSTVAVLGFALRTLADQLEKGQLEALVAEHRAQAGSRAPAPRGSEPRRGGGDGQPRQVGLKPQDLVVIEHGVGADGEEGDGFRATAHAEGELCFERQPFAVAR